MRLLRGGWLHRRSRCICCLDHRTTTRGGTGAVAPATAPGRRRRHDRGDDVAIFGAGMPNSRLALARTQRAPTIARAKTARYCVGFASNLDAMPRVSLPRGSKGGAAPRCHRCRVCRDPPLPTLVVSRGVLFFFTLSRAAIKSSTSLSTLGDKYEAVGYSGGSRCISCLGSRLQHGAGNGAVAPATAPW